RGGAQRPAPAAALRQRGQRLERGPGAAVALEQATEDDRPDILRTGQAYPVEPFGVGQCRRRGAHDRPCTRCNDPPPAGKSSTGRPWSPTADDLVALCAKSRFPLPTNKWNKDRLCNVHAAE